MGTQWTVAGKIWWDENAASLLNPVAFTGDTTTGSASVANVSSFTGLVIGQLVIAAGVPLGTYITALDSVGATLTLSANATATAATVDMTALGDQGETLPLSVHLLQDPLPNGSQATWNQVTEADYDGYAPQEVDYPPVVSSPDGDNVAVSFQCMTFAPTDYLVTNRITGYAFTYTAAGASGPTLVAFEPFGSGINLAETGDLIRLIPTLFDQTDATDVGSTPVLA